MESGLSKIERDSIHDSSLLLIPLLSNLQHLPHSCYREAFVLRCFTLRCFTLHSSAAMVTIFRNLSNRTVSLRRHLSATKTKKAACTAAFITVTLRFYQWVLSVHPSRNPKHVGTCCGGPTATILSNGLSSSRKSDAAPNRSPREIAGRAKSQGLDPKLDVP